MRITVTALNKNKKCRNIVQIADLKHLLLQLLRNSQFSTRERNLISRRPSISSPTMSTSPSSPPSGRRWPENASPRPLPSPTEKKDAAAGWTDRPWTMIWTPRSTRLRGKGKEILALPRKSRFPFAPATNREYQAPPPPPPLKKPPAAKAAYVSYDELAERAEELRNEADALEKQYGTRHTPLGVQLGMLLQTNANNVNKIIRDWDSRGRGEFLKGEFRLVLKGIGLMPTPAEADELFDEWDDDHGGTLDMREVKVGLTRSQDQAKSHQQAPDPNAARAQALRQRAAMCDEAAETTSKAEALEEELDELEQSLASRADVRLGELLAKRRIKPGAVVFQWSHARGEHAGELSKSDFREAVCALGLASTNVSMSDIDAVFDKYDADQGGWMDEKEAHDMIKGLQAEAVSAQSKKFRKERQAQAMRARAVKKAAAAKEPIHVPEMEIKPPEKVSPKKVEASPKKARRNSVSKTPKMPVITED